MEAKMSQTAVTSSQAVYSARQWADKPQFWFVSSRLLSGFICLMLLGLLVAVGWFLYDRWRLRRRAARIGLNALPATDQLRLARQLGFYDDLVRLLERHRIERPSHLTPLEFSDSLAYLPTEVYDGVRRLTLLFYRVRYGHAQLRPAQQRRLISVITRLSASMGGTVSPAGDFVKLNPPRGASKRGNDPHANSVLVLRDPWVTAIDRPSGANPTLPRTQPAATTSSGRRSKSRI
jgi:hypothetical protein